MNVRNLPDTKILAVIGALSEIILTAGADELEVKLYNALKEEAERRNISDTKSN